MFLLLCTAQVKIAQRIGLIQHLPTGTFDGCKKNREWDSESGVLWRIMFLIFQGVSSAWSSSMSATQCATCPACTSTTWRCYTANCFSPLELTPHLILVSKCEQFKMVVLILILTFAVHRRLADALLHLSKLYGACGCCTFGWLPLLVT